MASLPVAGANLTSKHQYHGKKISGKLSSNAIHLKSEYTSFYHDELRHRSPMFKHSIRSYARQACFTKSSFSKCKQCSNSLR